MSKKDERQIVWRDVVDLIPYAANARTHTDEQVAQIAASIKEFGWTNPVLTDGENGIVAGHGRVLAARKLGLDQVPTLPLSGLSKRQLRAYVLADNKLAENAGWDRELLAVELGGLKDDGFDLGLIGFSGEELDLVFSPATVEDIETAFDRVPEGDREPFQQMTFTLHDDQAEQVKQALERAKALGAFDGPNENSNGNALARVCETFLTTAGNG